MKIRLYNCRILSMVEGEEIFEGEVWVDGNRIVFAGTREQAAKMDMLLFDREIDGEGNLLLPGFKDAHTHSAMTFLRSYADDVPLQQWLNEKVFPMEAKLQDEDAYWLAKLAVLEYLTSGITSHFDMYMFNDQIARAAVDSGFRTVLCGSVNNYVGSVSQMREDAVRLNNVHERVSFRLGFHAEYTTDRAILEEIANLAQERKEPVFTHAAETRTEVSDCVSRYGTTPVTFLDQLGMFDYGGGIFHGIYLSAQDRSVMREKKISVVTNPASNLKLASGICQVERLLAEGIQVAIGTDGPASNNCLDMFREMFLVCGLQKILNENAASMPACEVLRMACVSGASVMGLDECDSIAPGKLADLVLINLKRPNMQPMNDLVSNLVYSGSKENVKLTMVNGVILYEDGQFYLDCEADEIYRKANEIITEKKGV